LRDEEAIGIQMQKDQMANQRQNDFVDLEMQAMMEQELKNEQQQTKLARKIKKKQNKKQRMLEKKKEKELASKVSTWFVAAENEIESAEVESEIESANVEKIEKQSIGSSEAKIIKRDHPELPGMLKELKDLTIEMEVVFNERLRAIKKRFDDAIEDSTLFLDLLRTYASTICFYLQLKAKKIDSETMKKHGIFSVLLKLKQRTASFRNIYKQSMQFMNNLPENWDRSEYLKQKRELFEYEKQRQLKISEQRKEKEENEERIKKHALKKERKHKKKEQKELKTLFHRGFNRLNNSDKKLEGDDTRRHVTEKIFKSKGLKRYRKQGIPRVKARLKWEKKQKAWKRKGYKKFTGKSDTLVMKNNINTKWTHSKRLT